MMDDLINKITAGDSTVLSEALEPESIDFIYTDPVYDQFDQYQWLGLEAERVLKPDSAALVWARNDLLLQAGNALSKGLSYRALFSWYQANNMRIYGHIFNKWVPLFWFEKGKSKPHRKVQDLRKVSLSVGKNRQDRFHKWAKRTELIAYYLEAFTLPGELVFDPFAGGGVVPYVCEMLDRRYIAFELDEAKVATAVERAAEGRERRAELCAV